MKKYVWEFARRGLVSCGFGPIVLAIVYLILRHTIDLQTLPVKEVCTGILSLFALAFIAGGMNFLYQIERLPLMLAILIHGGVLYLSYLGTYLLNGWLDRGLMPILIFTGLFLLGYLVIWVVIYSIIKRKTDKINRLLQEKQQSA
jgi:hypothetical protein